MKYILSLVLTVRDWYEAYEEYGVPGKVIVTGKLTNFQKHGNWECHLSTGQAIKFKWNPGIKGRQSYPAAHRYPDHL